MKIQRDLDETKIILVSVMYLNLLLLTLHILVLQNICYALSTFVLLFNAIA
jgi:hypothetical protein